MNKFTTLSFALLFAAGTALAQSNDASIDQVGDDHDAMISQTGSLNDAHVLQTADAGREGSDVGTADVTQDGSENSVNLRQRNFFGNNVANITQVGSGNSVQGTSAGSAFLQNHGLNIIDVMMEGDDNTLYSLRGEAQKNTNTLLLDILGDGNTVGLLQEHGYADISLTGSFNDVVLDQKANNNANRQTAYVDVTGSDNLVDVSQRGQAGTADITQNGDDNTAFVRQNGVGNSVLIEQGVYGGATASIADFTQIGDGNYFETKQVRSVDNRVTGTQLGDDNYYRASVRGEDNSVSMDVAGDENRGSWAISSLGWPHQPTGNSLTLDVTGSNNYSTGSIAGDNNTVTVAQDGLGNRLGTSWYTSDGVSIAGDANSVSIGQFSDYNTASVSVAGNSNTATITQN
ncbi:hypothetical protein [Rhodohalobacter sp. SW132]|uniref:hypothetical protein n=1 Tax=Rhodohalobacter sp. SW132 TaxID=2293433 RepID=UPI001314DACA|nr:hypothetical protein [Rhodohalobacter sp. SW132]